MIIGVLNNVYFNIHSAKHESTWFTSSAYRIFYKVLKEHVNFAVWEYEG